MRRPEERRGWGRGPGRDGLPGSLGPASLPLLLLTSGPVGAAMAPRRPGLSCSISLPCGPPWTPGLCKGNVCFLSRVPPRVTVHRGPRGPWPPRGQGLRGDATSHCTGSSQVLSLQVTQKAVKPRLGWGPEAPTSSVARCPVTPLFSCLQKLSSCPLGMLAAGPVGIQGGRVRSGRHEDKRMGPCFGGPRRPVQSTARTPHCVSRPEFWVTGGLSAVCREKDGGPAEGSGPGTPTSQLGGELAYGAGGWRLVQSPRPHRRQPAPLPGVTGSLLRGLAEKSGLCNSGKRVHLASGPHIVRSRQVISGRLRAPSSQSRPP